VRVWFRELKKEIEWSCLCDDMRWNEVVFIGKKLNYDFYFLLIFFWFFSKKIEFFWISACLTGKVGRVGRVGFSGFPGFILGFLGSGRVGSGRDGSSTNFFKIFCLPVLDPSVLTGHRSDEFEHESDQGGSRSRVGRIRSDEDELF
jgi:hypothetical protein